MAMFKVPGTEPFAEKNLSFSTKQKTRVPLVLINEIMFDPDPSQGLPPYEYIELHNGDTQPVNLKNWKLNKGILPDVVLSVGAYLIICKKGQESEFLPFGSVVGISLWDVLNNEGQEIMLEDSSGALIDLIFYTPDLIREADKKNGGWSIELINPFEICKGMINWKVASHPLGGTPGRKNSVYSGVPDETPPIIVDHRWISPDTLQLYFSEPMESLPDDLPQFFTFTPALEILHIFEDEKENFSIFLAMDVPIKKGNLYDLSVSGFSDCIGNRIKDTVIQTGIGSEPAFLDLLITELMIDELPVVDLPASEYIEIFNVTDQIMDLGNTSIITLTDTFSLPPSTLLPHQYIVLCPQSRIHLFWNIPNVKGIRPFPRLLNDGQVLALFNRHDKLVFSMKYNTDWYRDLEKSNGGYAIEMVDTANPCGDENNWCASDNPSGGTPGQPNSVSQSNPDRTGPGIQMIYMTDPSQIQVKLTEKINPSSTGHLEISFQEMNGFHLLSFDSLFYDQFTLSLSHPLSASTQYEMNLKGLRDCVGNSMDPVESRHLFYLPRKAERNDLVINELLFNPKPGGVDWVEIYNKSNDYIDLTGLTICNITDDHPDHQVPIDPPHQLLPPSGFLVITADRNLLIADFPKSRQEAILELKSMPPLPDQFGNIALITEDQNILDLFYYHSSYHHDLITEDEGISLERISYTDSTNQPDNWQSASSIVGYGSPTFENSVHYNASSGQDLILLVPTVITPDGDGIDDHLQIHYSTGKPGYVGNIEIYDIAGNLVKGVLKNRLLAVQGTITWDGHSEQGQIPRTGIYILRFEIYNLEGDRRQTKKRFVVTRKF
jgi:hypothetical protein